jgi:hypothetical protein
LVGDSEPESSLVQASQEIQKINKNNALATIANSSSHPGSPSEGATPEGGRDAGQLSIRNPKAPYAGEVVFFGENASYGTQFDDDRDED